MATHSVSVYRREPSALEVEDASSHIASAATEMSALQTQILELQAQIHSLQRRQATYQQLIDRHKGVITLARRIPPELLADIFEQCVDGGWTRAPIIVSHVCSQWRLAAQDPRVWSRIYINLDDADSVARTKHWLRMARAAPLHITVVASSRVWPRQIIEVMTMLSRYTEQWTTLRMELEALQNVQAVAESCRFLPVTPRLRTISMSTMGMHPAIEGETEDSLTWAEIFTQERAPGLRSFSIELVTLPTVITLPSHVRSLELTFIPQYPAVPVPAVPLMNVLNQLPALERLTLSLPLHQEQPFSFDIDQFITLPSLVSLTVFGPTDLNGLLEHVEAPAVRELRLRSLEDLGYRQTPIGPSLFSFLQRSSAVEILELHDIDLTPEYFASCFSYLGGLRELNLHESSISTATMKLLYGPGNDAEDPTSSLRMCPRLTRLNLRWCGMLPGKSLVELVRSRIHTVDGNRIPVSPISEIAAINCCFVEERDVVELARMTVCRVVAKETDYCRASCLPLCLVQRYSLADRCIADSARCCDNARYRQRLRFRHFSELSPEQRSKLRLII